MSLIKTKFIFCTNSNNHRDKCDTNNKYESKLETSITNTNQHSNRNFRPGTRNQKHLYNYAIRQTILTPADGLETCPEGHRFRNCRLDQVTLSHDPQFPESIMPCALTIYRLQHCKLRQIFQKAMCQQIRGKKRVENLCFHHIHSNKTPHNLA